jgi:hypothetical protein
MVGPVPAEGRRAAARNLRHLSLDQPWRRPAARRGHRRRRGEGDRSAGHREARARGTAQAGQPAIHRRRSTRRVLQAQSAAPKLKPYLRRPNPTWPEIIDATDWLRHDLDVSKPLWGDACLAKGRELAAVALAIVSTKEAEHFRTSPGGYFHGMVAKAKAGELHLERTVWALRRASQPEQHQRADRGSKSFASSAFQRWLLVILLRFCRMQKTTGKIPAVLRSEEAADF